MELTKESSNKYYTLKLILTEGDYSITDNESPLNYELQLISGSIAHFQDFRIGRTIVLDGETIHEVKRADASQYTLGYNSKITLASGKVDIKHDADGSKTVSVSFSIDMASTSYSPGAISGNGSIKLTTIPRQATIIAAVDFNDEENPTITYKNPLGNKADDVLACISFTGSKDDIIYRSISKSGTNYTFNLTEEERDVLRNYCKDSNSKKLYFYIRTIIGGKNHHSRLEKTLTIVNANPTYDESKITWKDTNTTTLAVTKNNQIIVQEKSELSVVCGTATGKKGATISRYEAVLNGVKKTLTNANGGTISMGSVAVCGNFTLSVTAVDSRGNTIKVEAPITVIPYQKPILTRHTNYGQISCERCDSEGVIDRNGTHLKLIIQGKWFSLINGENQATVDVQITTKNYESAWLTIPAEAIGGGAQNSYQSWYDINTVVDGVELDYTKAYVVTVRCIDSFGDSDDETTYTDLSYKIPTCAVAFHLGKGGNKAAIGTYADEDYVFKIDDVCSATAIKRLKF